MDDKSTTDAADNQDVDANANANADQPTDQDKASTDNQTADNTSDDLDNTSKSTDTSDDDDKSTKDDGGDDAPANKFDTDLDEWATKTKRKVPETDAERALLQEIRDDRREQTRNSQAKDAEKDVNKVIKDAKPADNKLDTDDEDVDPLEQKISALEKSNQEERNLRLRSEYFSDKDVSSEEVKAMGEILKEKTDKGGKQAYDYWTNPDQLDDWHQLAKARLSTETDTSAIETEAARKERARIAKEQQSSGPSRNASTQTTKTKDGYDRAAFLQADD